jgi:hypothetical protein
MNLVGRIIVVTIVALATYFLSYWLPVALIRFNGYEVVAPIIALVCAMAVGWFVWKALDPRSASGILSTMFLWAAVAGGIGFVGGFLGPMLFAPSANQGPLLGIFITGPLGFLLGGVTGFAYALHQKRKNGSLG